MPVLKKLALLIVFINLFSSAFSQGGEPGLITGTALDENKKAIEGATVSLISMQDSLKRRSALTDKDGSFTFSHIAFGYYRLRLSYVGLQTISLDSIYFRTERFDFNLNDIVLKAKSSTQLD